MLPRIIVTILFVVGVRGDDNYRLTGVIIPTNYHITITPYFETGNNDAFTFDGEVRITFQTVEENQSTIKLHSLDLTYEEVAIKRVSDNTAKYASYTFDTKYEFATIQLDDNLDPNIDYELYIKYKGPISDTLLGFYRSSYIENGVTKWLGATQMQGTHARKVFPCFDEPKFKATFDLVIDRPSSYKQSLTNTKLKSTEVLDNGYVRETFHTSPIMSTYLVAFLVSEFEATNYYSTENGEEFGIWARPGAKEQGQAAFDYGRKILDAYNDYFQVDYYSSNENLKLDHVGLPDFSAGAMENWGLIKYREGYLMFVPEESIPMYEQRMAGIVAHESAHLWFGDLVTCHWWGDGWLNEGFANFFETYILIDIAPELYTEGLAVTGGVHSALNNDQTEDVPAISNPEVYTPEDISGHFGTQTYAKPGSVIRMIKYLIGDEAFRNGLQVHLNASRFQAVVPDNLYEAIQSAVDDLNALQDYPTTTISGLMKTWIDQKGYPVVDVEVDYAENEIHLKQERFYINGSKTSDEVYAIPISYTTQTENNFDDTKPKFILNTKEITFKNNNLNDSWIILNVQESGLYRVNYDSQTWTLITESLKETNSLIHYINRASIVNDVFALAQAGRMTYEQLYDILEFLKSETNYFVWVPAINGLNSLRTKLQDADQKAALDEYVKTLVANMIENVGYADKPQDKHIDLRSRTDILNFVCNTLEETNCVRTALNLFNEFKTNGTYLTPSLRPAVYCTGIRDGTSEDYKFMFERMTTTNVANEGITIRAALACTQDKASLEEYLTETLISQANVRSQDQETVVSAILTHDYNIETALEFVKNNIETILTKGSKAAKILASFPPVLNTAQLNEFEEWLAECEVCGQNNMEAVTKAVVNSKAQLDWVSSNIDNIIQPLKARNSAVASVGNLLLIMSLLMVNLLKC